ncbi:hydrogenase maturation nickel metallochaperone HypA [Nonomuraea sp. MG754425]|uniref:hydrogenase maturation nickel metallochaperone HypA n=1 Tax=Nonomuraea sp. MG754425 TaxID=2570319 RepID=UPI001F16D6C5|nr:hydrogenase maturation nickel metallochaperone HypA [Nonomuraea sp. MG754425]MCF6469650.1 hydrogenase maturation nickel metallochaperone HypA [Nonomuraea sp. MG754425]
MHEIGLCEGLVELIHQQAGGRPVASARVRVGARHAVVQEAFGQAFTLAAAGTAAQDAVIDLVIMPMTVECRSCGDRSESVDTLANCPRCTSGDVDVTGGDELVLESVWFSEGAGARVPGHPR